MNTGWKEDCIAERTMYKKSLFFFKCYHSDSRATFFFIVDSKIASMACMFVPLKRVKNNNFLTVAYSIVKDINADLTVGNCESKIDP